MLGAAPRFASFAYFGFASKGIGHEAVSSFSPALLLLTALAFSSGALFVTTAAADSCSSVRGGAKVDPSANPDQSQPPGQCSVRGLTESECDDVPGHKHFEKDSDSGFTDCFFDPPTSSARPSRNRAETNPNTHSQGDEDNECIEHLIAVEETVRDKLEANTLSEADVDNVNELLDQADALCTDGKFAEATATLATVNKMVGK
jgi:hypothetical protein